MVRLLLDGGFYVLQYGHAGLYTAKMKGDQDMVDLLESRGATLAALTDNEKETWAREDGDGTLPIPQRLFISYADEIERKRMTRKRMTRSRMMSIDYLYHTFTNWFSLFVCSLCGFINECITA